MSEKIKGMFGSESRADEVLEWLKSQGAKEFMYNGWSENTIYYVDKGIVKVVDKSHSVLFDIVELPRWRAKEGEIYYYVNIPGCVSSTTDERGSCDESYYVCGNYFKTREEAEKVAGKIREIFGWDYAHCCHTKENTTFDIVKEDVERTITLVMENIEGIK